jgi:hypothetical protein
VSERLAADGSPQPLLLVDAHVHVHACFDLATLLEHAVLNFAAAARAVAAARPWRGVLCFTETAQADCFGTLAHCAQKSRSPAAGWAVAATAEPAALVVASCADGGTRLVVIAGSQIVSAEKLEVLALGTTRRFADHEPIAATLEAILAAGAAAVLPWGFGKWRGARARALDAVLTQPRPGALYLGDTSNRLRLMPRPAPFARRGWSVLPGTDPLPLRGEERRVGSYGLLLDAALDEARPTASLLDLLARPPGAWRAFGRREGPARFVRNQLAMQVGKRRAA